jgi:hypothetical protein
VLVIVPKMVDTYFMVTWQEQNDFPKPRDFLGEAFTAGLDGG